VLCHNAFTVSVLYTMDADGGRALHIYQHGERVHASVLADGRLTFTVGNT